MMRSLMCQQAANEARKAALSSEALLMHMQTGNAVHLAPTTPESCIATSCKQQSPGRKSVQLFPVPSPNTQLRPGRNLVVEPLGVDETNHRRASHGANYHQPGASGSDSNNVARLINAGKKQQPEMTTDPQRAMFLLRKNSFTCMVIGARQTGKRSIVKCFVKLLNEFKLAAGEYKKEKVLSKLVECSERLQELTNRREELIASNQQHQQISSSSSGNNHLTANHNHQQHDRRRSRLNSWLPGSGTVNKLLNLSPKGKRRLHSVIGIWGDDASDSNNNNNNDNDNVDESAHHQQQQQHQLTPTTTATDNKTRQRRHTTFEQRLGAGGVDEQVGPEVALGPGQRWPRSGRFLSVVPSIDDTLAVSAPVSTSRTSGPMLSACGNKSDTNVNYCADERKSGAKTTTTTTTTTTKAVQNDTDNCSTNSAFTTTHQLHVPQLTSTRQPPTPGQLGGGGTGSGGGVARQDQRTCSTSSDVGVSSDNKLLLHQQSNEQDRKLSDKRARQTRKLTPPISITGDGNDDTFAKCAKTTGLSSSAPRPSLCLATPSSSSTAPATRRHTSANAFATSRPEVGGGGRLRKVSMATAAIAGGGARSQRRQSIALSRRRQRILLSLKELNRRKCGIKFKSRRQVSESCLHQLQRQSHVFASSDSTSGPCRRQPRRASAFKRSALMQADLNIDSIIVVYSINDRESFECAKTMISQLRANKLEIPLPIVLVANKIDLERVRVIKREEGRSLACKNACKFIEISCTIGFNLDNLLVGLRTQMILRHHIILNSILGGKVPKTNPQFDHQNATRKSSAVGDKNGKSTTTTLTTTNDNSTKSKTINNNGSNNNDSKSAKTSAESSATSAKVNENILVRFYRRYVMDDSKYEYDCDNFSKL